LFALAHANVQVLSGRFNGTVITSAEFYKKGDDFTQFFAPITGLLVDATSNEVNGNIAYLAEVPKSQFWTRIFELKSRGVIGVVSGAIYPVPGQDFCTWTGEDVSQIDFPIAAVFHEDIEDLHSELLNGEQILITMTSEGNPWADAIITVSTVIVFRVILGGFAASLAIFGSYKLAVFIKHQGSKFNIPQVVLALEVVANLWRVMYLTVDPLGCSFVYGSAVNSFTDTVSIPYPTATFVLISFYWYEIVTDASIMIYPFLNRLKIPFFVITFILIAMDMTLSLLGFYLEFSTSTPTSIIYLIISVALLAFYVVTLVKVMGRMRISKEVRGESKKFRRLSDVNTKMILNAVGRLCVIIVGIAYVFPAVNRQPVPYVVIWAFLYFTLNVDSLMRLILFDTPKGSTSSSSKPTGSATETKLTTRNSSPSLVQSQSTIDL
jgi:hypothetical protein